MQWISFFVSTVAFFFALKQAGIAFDDKDISAPYAAHDLEKIAKNFGRSSDSLSTLRALYDELRSNVSEAKEALDGLWVKLQNYVEPLWISQDSGDFCREAGQYITEAENFFYRTGINNEQNLLAEAMYWSAPNDNDPSKAQKKEQSSLGDYLEHFLSQQNVRYRPEDCIGVLLMTMDAGVTAMTIRDSIDVGKQPSSWVHRVVNWVRAGEQSLYLEARRYYRFFPALIELEARCLRSGYNVEENVKAFGKALEKEGCFQKSSDSRSVPQRMADFYNCVREYGYRLRDWNFDFLIDLDVPKKVEDEGDWNGSVRPKRELDDGQWEDKVQRIREIEEYYQYECQQQQNYVLKARNFPLS